MTELVKETVITEGNTLSPAVPVLVDADNMNATNYQTFEYLVYFIFGVLEVLLIFRFILKFMGASYASTFVNFIYAITGIFIMPFEGIFSKWYPGSLASVSVVETSTLVAIVVYGVIGFGLVKLIRILSGKKQIAS